MNFSNILLMIFQLHGLVLKDPNLMESTCSNTPNYNLCLSTLAASPNSATADVEGLALIVVDAVKHKAETGLSRIEEIEGEHPKQAAALQRCSRTYRAVVKGDVPEAVAGLTKGVPKFAQFGMEDAAWEAKICEGSFGGAAEGEEEEKTPLSGVNRELHDLAEVAVAIVKNLL